MLKTLVLLQSIIEILALRAEHREDVVTGDTRESLVNVGTHMMNLGFQNVKHVSGESQVQAADPIDTHSR